MSHWKAGCRESGPSCLGRGRRKRATTRSTSPAAYSTLRGRGDGNAASLPGVQHFTPLYKNVARPHRRRVGARWSIDETYIRIAGRWCYAFRAIDEEGQVIDVYVSPTRDTAAATAFLTRAVERTDVTPYRATTDKAPIYPPAFAAVLPGGEHVTGKREQQRIERDHQHLKGRTRSMRGFQTLPCAQTVCDGHGFMRNLRDGFYDIGGPVGDPRVPQAPRLVRAWDELTLVLAAA